MLDFIWSWWIDPEFKRKQDFLQRVSIFRGISRREFGQLFQALVTREYAPGEILCKEGDIGRALFILETGQVEVTRVGSQGDIQRIAQLTGGDYFGEMSLIDERPRTASVTAMERVHAYLLYKAEIDKLLRTAPRIAAAIMAHLASLMAARLRGSMSRTPISLDSSEVVERRLVG